MSNKKKPLVLIVDDNPENLKVLGNILKENGLSTAFALNGTKALTSVKNKQPYLILLDIMMPDISGFEVCKQLKQEAATKDIPVIFLSAKTEKEDVIAGLELGAVDYVTKPFNRKELMIRVNTHLELKAAKEELKQKVEQLQAAQEELNQTVEQLKQACQAAEAANRAKSTFLANMSHELRTPLNGILGYTQIFQLDNSLNKEQQQGINVIHHCGEHLLIMISDILELAKIEAGRMELYPNDFSLTFLLKSSADLFQMRAQQKGIAFNYQQTSHFPQFVHADDKRLRQIIINLLSNAIKFTKQGGVTFKVDYFDEKIRLQVEDTGVGIAPDDMTHIFKPFLQVGDPKYKAEGTGLGLAITKQLVEMMGGKLQVESTLGQGCTFWTVLDLPTASAVPLKTTEEAIIIGFEQSPQKILVVDDKWENRTVLVKLLKPLGFEIIEAENGQQAIDKALINHPEAILMDIIMPTMDGLEATNKLRKIPEFFNTIIIALSA
ncbi:MAG: hybrid sensor histidine kinase/response regulator, partial [Candidatus Parabeggiatoa sp. nov. 1]